MQDSNGNRCGKPYSILILPEAKIAAKVWDMYEIFEERNLKVAEVFESLRQRHELLIGHDEVDPIELTLDTKVRDWQCYSEDMGRTWLYNAQLLNQWFDMDAPLAEWKAVLRPAKTKALSDVCSFVARHAKVLCIPEPNFLGRLCRTAGAFLMIREMMNEAGVNTENLRPSSLVSHYREKGLPEIISMIMQISPELRHRARIWYRNDWLHLIAGFVLFVATFVLLPVGIHASFLILAMGLLCFASFIYIWHKSEKYASQIYWVEIENVNTIRDLCHLLVGTGQFATRQLL